MNSITLMGRITKDLELKYSNNNKPYCNFCLAVKRKEKDEVDFINCTVWNKQAENLVKYQNKGSRILVNGSLRIEKINEKTYSRVIVSELSFIDYKEKENSTNNEYDDNFPF